jgi:hypothetical protein
MLGLIITLSTAYAGTTPQITVANEPENGCWACTEHSSFIEPPQPPGCRLINSLCTPPESHLGLYDLLLIARCIKLFYNASLNIPTTLSSQHTDAPHFHRACPIQYKFQRRLQNPLILYADLILWLHHQSNSYWWMLIRLSFNRLHIDMSLWMILINIRIMSLKYFHQRHDTEHKDLFKIRVLRPAFICRNVDNSLQQLSKQLSLQCNEFIWYNIEHDGYWNILIR